MNEFIPTIRTDRYREINKYKKKGFTFTKEKKYLLTNTIEISISSNERITFEVRVDFSEIRFYIIKNSTCIYLTIYQLYLLMNEIYNSDKIDLVLQVERLINKKKKEKFSYRDVMYEITKSFNFSDKHKVYIPDSNTFITYTELFYLLILIQEKSNYLCSLSKTKSKYSFGLYRLLIALISSNRDHKILQKIGWYYDHTSGLFKRNNLSKKNNRVSNSEKSSKKSKHDLLVERKYYLTQKELDNILGIES